MVGDGDGTVHAQYRHDHPVCHHAVPQAYTTCFGIGDVNDMPDMAAQHLLLDIPTMQMSYYLVMVCLHSL